MTTVGNVSFFQEMKTFIGNHKLLCVMTLGLAIVCVGTVKFCGRAWAWIRKPRGTTEKTDRVAQEKLKKMGEEKAAAAKAREKEAEAVAAAKAREKEAEATRAREEAEAVAAAKEIEQEEAVARRILEGITRELGNSLIRTKMEAAFIRTENEEGTARKVIEQEQVHAHRETVEQRKQLHEKIKRIAGLQAIQDEEADGRGIIENQENSEWLTCPPEQSGPANRKGSSGGPWKKVQENLHRIAPRGHQPYTPPKEKKNQAERKTCVISTDEIDEINVTFTPATPLLPTLPFSHRDLPLSSDYSSPYSNLPQSTPALHPSEIPPEANILPPAPQEVSLEVVEVHTPRTEVLEATVVAPEVLSTTEILHPPETLQETVAAPRTPQRTETPTPEPLQETVAAPRTPQRTETPTRNILQTTVVTPVTPRGKETHQEFKTPEKPNADLTKTVGLSPNRANSAYGGTRTPKSGTPTKNG